MSGVLHRNLAARLPSVVAGDGCYLIDCEGRRYLDASGGAAVSCLGHSHPGVIAAVQRQVGSLAFAHTSFFTNGPSEALAERLLALAPAEFGRGRVAFVGGGSEAVEVALKLARQHHVEAGRPRRSRFISRRFSYHGNTLGALAVGGNPARRAMYEPMLMDTTLIGPCHPYRFQRTGESLDAYGQRAADELDAAIERLGAETVAAFIAEPVVGATLGSAPPVAGYFRRIREICDRHGVLLIADEVMCGMGRTGSMFALGAEGVSADMITIAKGLGGGYQPIGAMMASEATMRPIAQGSGQLANGHTYMSHLVACAAALAVVTAITEEDLVGRVRRLGTDLERALRQVFGDHPHVGDIRGRGLFWSLELVEDRGSKSPFPARFGLAATIKAIGMKHGLICYPSSGSADGRSGDHVLVAPPYIVTEAQLAELVEILHRVIDESIRAARSAA